MKLEVSPQGKTVVDDHEDNFAIVFAAMGVSLREEESEREQELANWEFNFTISASLFVLFSPIYSPLTGLHTN